MNQSVLEAIAIGRLVNFTLDTTLKDCDEKDISHAEETLNLLKALSRLDNKITSRPPYDGVRKAKISEDARKHLLEFNALYQISMELSKSTPNTEGISEIQVTETQFEMPVAYVAKCGFFYLAKQYYWAPKKSAKKGYNRRLIGGFFSRIAGGHMPDPLETRLKDIRLSRKYGVHYINFARTVNSAAHAILLGRLLGQVASAASD